MDLFNNKEIDNNVSNKNNNFISTFIKELKNALKNIKNEGTNMNEKDNLLDEYNLYEKRKIFLDNKSRRGNQLAWVMDNNSVCISENGDGGPYSIADIDLPKNAKVGEVYEKIDGVYVYNSEITEELNKIVNEIIK